MSADLGDGEVAGERSESTRIATGPTSAAVFQGREGVDADVEMEAGQRVDIGEDGPEVTDRDILSEVTGEGGVDPGGQERDAGIDGQ